MIRLFTDTSANLPYELIQRHNITVVPFSYTADEKEVPYDDKTDFDGKTFYDAMRRGCVIKTSMISVDTYMNYFEPAAAAGDDVLYVGMSSGISGSYNSSCIAARELKEKYPSVNICTVDTYAASLGEGFMVIKAAELIQKDKTFSEIEDFLLQMREHVCQFFTVDDLGYLKKGGRISSAVALIGSVLNIKPILKGDETGHIIMCDKARGSKKAITNLADKYAKLAFDKDMRIGIAHADNEPGANLLLELLRAKGFRGNCLTVCYEPVTGSHVGPGTVALFFYGMHR